MSNQGNRTILSRVSARQQASEMFRNGATLNEVVEHLGIKRSTASSYLWEARHRAKLDPSYVASDYVLLNAAFENRAEPLARDVVIVNNVADYVRRQCHSSPSNDRIGKILAGPPFNGIPKQIRVGDELYRVILIRNQSVWVGASGRDTMAHIQGQRELTLEPVRDPLCD